MTSLHRIIDASLRRGELVSRGDRLRELMAIDSVRAGSAAALVLTCCLLAAVALAWRSESASVKDSVSVIARTVNTTRKLYAGRVDVGSGSVMTTLLRVRPYEDQPVKVVWHEGGALEVLNTFGGRIDVVALRDHFEVRFGAVPAAVCSKLLVELAPSRVPSFVNTIYFAGPAGEGQAAKACNAEVNNMVFKFR